MNRSADGASHTFCGVTPRPQIENVQHCTVNKYLFASTKLKGTKPRSGGIASQTYLYPAAAKAGVIHSVEKRNQDGKLVTRYFDLAGNPIKRWGWHNLRHSLASWLVSEGVDVKTVSSMLRHSNIKTTLGIYSHAVGLVSERLRD